MSIDVTSLSQTRRIYRFQCDYEDKVSRAKHLQNDHVRQKEKYESKGASTSTRDSQSKKIYIKQGVKYDNIRQSRTCHERTERTERSERSASTCLDNDNYAPAPLKIGGSSHLKNTHLITTSLTPAALHLRTISIIKDFNKQLRKFVGNLYVFSKDARLNIYLTQIDSTLSSPEWMQIFLKHIYYSCEQLLCKTINESALSLFVKQVAKSFDEAQLCESYASSIKSYSKLSSTLQSYHVVTASNFANFVVIPQLKTFWFQLHDNEKNILIKDIRSLVNCAESFILRGSLDTARPPYFSDSPRL